MNMYATYPVPAALALGASVMMYATTGGAIPLEYARLATGFYPNSLATASQSCFQLNPNAQPVTTPSTRLSDYYLYNQSSSSSYWNISDSASSSYGKAHASGAVSKTSEAASSDKSALWIERYQYSIVESVTMDDIQLTPAGSALIDAIDGAAGKDDKEEAINNFIQSCGTRVITETFTGQSAALVLELKYASASDKESFDTSENAGYGSIADLSNAIQSTNTSASSSVSVVGTLYQLGGTPGSETAVSANVTAISGCSVDPTSGGLSSECANASQQFTDFIAGSAYQQQLVPTNPDNAVILYPTSSPLPVMLSPSDQTALTGLIAAYSAVYDLLDGEWQAQQTIYDAMDEMTRGEVDGMTNNSIISRMTSAKKSASHNLNLLNGYLSECNYGVCLEKYWQSYESKKEKNDPLAMSFAYLLRYNSASFDTGMIFSCDDDNVTINFNTANIAAVYLQDQLSKSGTLSLTLPSICATPGDGQTTAYAGYLQLNGISEDSVLAYLPFVIQRDPIFPTLVVSQNYNANTTVTIPSGSVLAGIRGTTSGKLATAASANSVTFSLNPGGGDTVAPLNDSGAPTTPTTPTLYFDATVNTTSVPTASP